MTKCTVLREDGQLCGSPGEATELVVKTVQAAVDKAIRRLYIKVGVCPWHRGDTDQAPSPPERCA